MAEERIIDDEYGRGVRLRKTKEGYVDVTDELAEEPTEEAEEEISFAFPMEEDDEDLVGLTPEEAEALRRQKAEAAERRRAEYEEAVAKGNELLQNQDFEEAEKTFERALNLDELATDASVGYWRAKTANFTNPDALIEEYVDAGIESLEYDLGYEATEIIKKEHRDVFQKRYDELTEKITPLQEKVTGKQEHRRDVLTARRKKHLIAFIAAALPFALFTALAIIFGLKNFSTRGDTYIPVTIVFAVLAVASFVAFAICSNKLLNTVRIFKRNERLTSTEEGEELTELLDYQDLYGELLKTFEEE